MQIEFSESDIKRTTTVETNWYQLEIVDYSERTSTTPGKDHTNCFVECVIKSNNPKFNAVPVTKVIPEMMKEDFEKLVKALGEGKDVEAGVRYNLSKAIIGTNLLAFIKPGADKNGKIRNNIEQWAPVSYLPELEAQGGKLG